MRHALVPRTVHHAPLATSALFLDLDGQVYMTYVYLHLPTLCLEQSTSRSYIPTRICYLTITLTLSFIVYL